VSPRLAPERLEPAIFRRGLDIEKASARSAEAFWFSVSLAYFTFKKIIARVYSASDSISTNPKRSAN
jgi:hypothetical protein